MLAESTEFSRCASTCREIFLDLKSRGLEEILIGVADGLTGLKDAFLSVYPKADFQLRNSSNSSMYQIDRNLYDSCNLTASIFPPQKHGGCVRFKTGNLGHIIHDFAIL
jgi:Transposase, Mutator family